MATATSFATPFFTGGLQSKKVKSLIAHQTQLALPQKSKLLQSCRSLSVCAKYSDDSGSGGGDFIAGFLLGGAIFGTLAYVFAPQIRRSLLNEDEHGFRKARRPIYYEEGLGLEETRQTLNAKIKQLNNAIDNVASRLRGGGKVAEPAEADSEFEASV
ncbi:uncharacterized protein LOC122017955 isoform X2 [Zingiber officinale]|uniref:Low-density receptor-like protein n=1 Tax=Zingiber officinale TaxID=94328 RepID=A0A8J5KFU1_ZINOF|nr:uncharacterized protein LOC122017955 isoform X2 [Zingiber officinale]KAG6482581.1 hypothetical protein ZIOFF_059213 [Zingiber officinale]